MKDQVFMSPNNGYLFVGVPLFRREAQEELAGLPGYMVSLSNSNDPVAYILDVGEACQLAAAEWVEKHVIKLGDL